MQKNGTHMQWRLVGPNVKESLVSSLDDLREDAAPPAPAIIIDNIGIVGD